MLVRNNLKNALLPIACITTAVMATPLQANADNTPTINTEINLAYIDAGKRDLDLRALKAHIGVGQVFPLDDGMKLRYDLVMDLSGEINGPDAQGQVYSSGETNTTDNGDIYVETAKMTLITKAGAFILGPRLLSGQWKHMYGMVDKFEYNRLHGQMGQAAVFGQAYQVGRVGAYGSPELLPGLKFYAALLTPIAYNDQDIDAKAARFIYNRNGVYGGIGRVWYSSKFPNVANYTRSSLTAGYKWDKSSIGATYEKNDNIANEYRSFAVVADLSTSDKTAITLGYANKSADNDIADKTGIIGKFKYITSKQTYAYIEGGSYEGKNGVNYADNVLVGMTARF